MSFTRDAAFLLGMLVMGAACSAAPASPEGSSSDAGPPQGPQLDALFTDPAMPKCEAGLGKQYQLKGQVDGQTIQVAASAFSNLDSNGFQTLEVAENNMVRTPLSLTWMPPLAEDTAIALTGASIIIPASQPLGGQSFCITSGKFGSRSLAAGAPGRELSFQITGARKDDCSGAETPIHLDGCIFRTNTYFPVPPKPAEAGLP